MLVIVFTYLFSCFNGVLESNFIPKRKKYKTQNSHCAFTQCTLVSTTCNTL